MRTQPSNGGTNRVLRGITRRQEAVVARWQLREQGLSSGAIMRRVQAGELVPIHRGVYLLGGAVLTVRAREFAAVLACGPQPAFLSHRSAAYRLGLLPYPAEYQTIDVSITTGGSQDRPGIRVHRVAALRRDESLRLDGLAITTVQRTLLDLASLRDASWSERRRRRSRNGGRREAGSCATSSATATGREPPASADSSSPARHRP